MSHQYGEENVQDHEANARKNKLIGIGAVGLVILIIFMVASSCSGGRRDIKPWFDEHYQLVSGGDPADETVVYTSDKDSRATVSEIITNTDPEDRFEGGTSTEGSASPVYLRYGSDWIVVVEPKGTQQSRIKLEEFDRAYSSYTTILPVFWGSHYGRSSGGSGFRGGGGGFGK